MQARNHIGQQQDDRQRRAAIDEWGRAFVKIAVQHLARPHQNCITDPKWPAAQDGAVRKKDL